MRDRLALIAIRMAAWLTSMGDAYDRLVDAEQMQRRWISCQREERR